MSDIVFKLKDFDINKITAEISAKLCEGLDLAGELAEGYAQDLCPTGNPYGGTLKQSITHEVNQNDLTMTLGTPVEYGIYVEYGTGTYANGGRQTPWVYFDEKTGKFYRTHGQAAQPFIKPALQKHKDVYKRAIEAALSK